MNEHRTLADDLRNIDMKWVWIIVSVIVLLGMGITPWEIVIRLVGNQGVGEDEATRIAFVACYTFPLTAGFSLIAFLVLSGKHSQFHLMTQLAGAAAILAFAGILARALGLGLLPTYKPLDFGGPWPVVVLAYVLSAYLYSHGITLMICAFAIGCAAALQAERYLHWGLKSG